MPRTNARKLFLSNQVIECKRFVRDVDFMTHNAKIASR